MGRLDSRFTGVDDRVIAETPEFDPSLAAIRPPYTAAFNHYVRTELGYRTDVSYELMNPDVLEAWNWTEAGQGDLPGVGQRLRSALSLNSKLKVLVVHGYFDLATPYFASKYVMERLELDEAIFPNIQFRVYEGGHMFYTHDRAREQLYEDARALYEQSSRTPPN